MSKFRYKLAELGEGTKIRIIAQYRHKAYDRLLLINVTLLEDYNCDIIEESDKICFANDYVLTDHVHLCPCHNNDRRLSPCELLDSGDIIICTCETYFYEYTGCLGINVGLRNPTDIVLIKPFSYMNNVVFMVQPNTARIKYWYYVGYGSREAYSSNWWDFSSLKVLAQKGEIQDGYSVIDETSSMLKLHYAEKNSSLIVYKLIEDAYKSAMLSSNNEVI